MVEYSFLWFRVYRDAAVLKGVKREKMQMPEILICHILKRQNIYVLFNLWYIKNFIYSIFKIYN